MKWKKIGTTRPCSSRGSSPGFPRRNRKKRQTSVRLEDALAEVRKEYLPSVAAVRSSSVNTLTIDPDTAEGRMVQSVQIVMLILKE